MISTTVNPMMTIEPAAIRAWAEERMIYVELSDGRIIGFPSDRFRILKQATNEQLAAVKVERVVPPKVAEASGETKSPPFFICSGE